MASSISPSDPTRTQWQPALDPVPPLPSAPKPRGRKSLFWPGFAVGFLLLASVVCGGLAATFGLTRFSLADIRNEGPAWTPPLVTVVASAPAAELAPVAGVSDRFAAGDQVRNVTNSRVNLRTTPGYLGKPAGDVVGLVEPGESMTMLGASELADNLVWWRVRYQGADGRQLEGWVAEAAASGVQMLARLASGWMTTVTGIPAAPAEHRPFAPRPAQAQILAYSDGPMGVSAVPGSGKTFTLSLLAARLVERLMEQSGLDDREILVVTFTNSAVGNFRARIGAFLREERGMLPGIGYRVRTLHGLAHDIVRERPGLVGLAEDFDIVDERTAAEIKRDAVLSYLRNRPDAFAAYIKPQYLQNPRSIERSLQEDAIDIANSVIRFAKERAAPPYQLQELLDRQSGTWPLAEFGLHIYADYQRSLTLRGAVDFDDLILLAIQALRADAGYLARLQDRWPYVLEDEAQDSSAGQERMLRMLAARHGNWVRVGDTNQAINTTFTSAEATFLVDFLKQHPDQARPLPNSGRSALPIIGAANFLIDWSRSRHPALPLRLALTPPHIEPTPSGDPQPNPEAGKPPVYLHPFPLAPEKELEIIVRSAAKWLPDNGECTVAVLAPDNPRCSAIVEALERQGLPFDDSLLRTDSTTRAAAQALATLLSYIASPQTPGAVANLWRDVWLTRRLPGLAAGDDNLAPLVTLAAQGRSGRARLPEPLATCERALDKLRTPETLIFPEQHDWLDTLEWLDEAPGMRELLLLLRSDLQRWTRAAILPVDELLLTLGNDIFSEPSDLALAHRLAVLLAKMQGENPHFRLPELANELTSIAQNRRRILGFGEDAQGYAPKPGVITVATMHAAKGLEWDRVYLTAVNTYSFPSGGEGDEYRSERWYVRDRLNLLAETQEQLKKLANGSLDEYAEGKATIEARLELAAERLRLFYVGATRARRELIVTYNTGRQHEQKPLPPAAVFTALQEYLVLTR